MRQVWLISDTHFGHANIIRYASRPFASVQEMDEAMADRWNERVKGDDLVYHLGDVAVGRGGLELFAKLPGTKRLLLGNHDDVGAIMRNAPVQKIELFRGFREEGFIASHMPLREDDLPPDAVNVHGHIHNKPAPSARHLNLCVEHTDYAPVPIEEVARRVRERAKAEPSERPNG